jgi:hypothetical protein
MSDKVDYVKFQADRVLRLGGRRRRLMNVPRAAPGSQENLLDHAPSVSSPARTSVGYALMIAATVGHALRVDERDLAVPDGEPLRT